MDMDASIRLYSFRYPKLSNSNYGRVSENQYRYVGHCVDKYLILTTCFRWFDSDG